MKRISFFWKIFISMFIVTCISLFILAITFRVSLPNFFSRHMTRNEYDDATRCSNIGEPDGKPGLSDIWHHCQ